MTKQEKAEAIANSVSYLSVKTVLRVKDGRKPKILPLTPMAEKALEQAVKRFDLEDHEQELLYIANAIAKGKVKIEGEDINEAYCFFTGV